MRILTTTTLVLGLAFAGSSPGLSAEARVFTQIDVEGNARFRDGDVLATAGLQPGGFYGDQELRSAIESLEFTGEFESVNITSQGSLLIITVDETPAYQGVLSFGAGFDSDTGAFGGATLELENALGVGAEVNGDVMIAQEVQTARLSVVNPDALGPTTALGVRLSYSNYDYEDTLFAYSKASIAPFVRLDLSERSGLEARLQFTQTDLRDVDPTASAILQGEVGKQDAISAGMTYSITSANSGAGGFSWGVVLDAEYAFGDDVKFMRTQARANVYQPLPAGFALRSALELGQISGRADYAPRATDRFVLGGASLRGFARGTISPRDIDGDTVTDLGGNSFGVLRTDLILPILTERKEVEVFLLADVGSVWGVETPTDPSGVLQKDGEIRNAFGAGASYEFEFGRLEAYLAMPGTDEVGDDEQVFGLTFRADF